MIEFKYVRWKNFLSTGNQFVEIQLDKNPTTLIIGENGAGKSTILDALCFGLFGKPFRMILKNQLINSVNNSSTTVEVEFNVGTRHYKVIRGIKPNKFEIYQNNKLMNLEANVRDYQKILEQQILKLNYRSFTQVVILGSSTFVPFMQLRARHRREVVEEILDIQIFSTMNVLLKQKLKGIVDELREVEYEFDLISEKVSLQENYIDDIQKNKDDIIKEKESSFNTNKYHIREKTEEIQSLEGDSKLLADDLIGEEQNKEKIKDTEKLKYIKDEYKVLKDQLSKNVKSDNKLDELFNSLKKINSKLWVIEDDKRMCEKKSDFNEKFIELSRDVHFLNDDRAKIKLEINNHTGSKIKEIKEYTKY